MTSTRALLGTLLAAVLTGAVAACSGGSAGVRPPPSGAAAATVPAPPSTKVTAGRAPAYGPVPIGKTRYPVPAGARFVAPGGNDTAAGTRSAPWRTLAHAVQRAPAGSAIVLRKGVYRESLEINRRHLTIQSYPGEAVWFDGSRRVTGWVRDGSVWRKDGWTTRFDNTDPTRGRDWVFQMTDPHYPMARWPDQVFVDGRELEQVADRAAVRAGTFAVDYATGRLYLGSNPAGATVEASVLSEALYLHGADGSVVRGIGFRRYATPIKRMGAVKGYANDLLFENDVFADTALTGLSIRGSRITVRRNAFLRNGQLGLQGHKSDGAVIAGNVMTGNNTAHFKIIPVAGGMKITTSRGLRVLDNDVEDNGSAGIWLDEACSQAVIARNVVRHNTGHGIQYEISDGALIAGNVVVDNARYGIRILESSRVRVWNNTVSANARRQIDVMDAGRLGRLTGVQLRNNLLESRPGGDQLLGVEDMNKRYGAAAMVNADGDAFYRPSQGPNALIHWVDPARKTKDLSGLVEFTDRTGQEAHGIAAEGPSPFTDRRSFRLRPGSDPLRAGLPLPADVATLLGLHSGDRAGIGAYGVVG
ncbi:right-handed parallel beta-helix repeat-containing protein [Actinomadura scrupuli]|uniref:right-handed parallel beta-helix repeat-containing protein n=1 Tax=Actinomadura scrupuli TaxID=559629 RepID=UPI003D959F5B